MNLKNLLKKAIASRGVKITVIVPEEQFEIDLTHVLVHTPETREPLTREQKMIRWIIVLGAVLALLVCTFVALAGWFFTTYQVSLGV